MLAGFGRTTALNAAYRCTSMNSPPPGQRPYALMGGATAILFGSEGWGFESLRARSGLVGHRFTRTQRQKRRVSIRRGQSRSGGPEEVLWMHRPSTPGSKQSPGQSPSNACNDEPATSELPGKERRHLAAPRLLDKIHKGTASQAHDHAHTAGYGTKIIPLGVTGPMTVVTLLTAPVLRLIVPR